MPVGTPAEIIAVLAPQYASDGRLTDLITLATGMTGAEFGAHLNYAIALRVLHWLAASELRGGDSGATPTTSGSGVAGTISSESEGDLSRSYNVSAQALGKDADLATTRWGLMLLSLRNDCLFAPRTRMM